ncbi:MAG: adenylosuccinate lyase [candidate division Zixibacteria bacterium SM23_73_2]|nr:MAG: adenylosuccinate lyase [candidate division Zixibacteria bacterium SM23_73_2]
MIERYTLPQMRDLWSEQTKFKTWLKIEILVCEALSQSGQIPKRAVDQIKKKARFDLKRIEQIEQKTRHDFLAFLTSVSENVGKNSEYIHLGLTSYDIEDTALAFILKQAGEVILKDLKNLSFSVKKKAFKYKLTPIMGRTHGVHAEPTTLGHKFALWYSEIQRNIDRLKKAIDIISTGKISGAVGNYANTPPEVERYVCKKLKLKPAKVSSQILQRDRHAEFLTTLAIIAGSIEKFSTEIRNLQRTEILELEEGFSKGQKGSSAMPHKRNPITCERLSGLSRTVRSYALASLENINLWHERDITNSSVERIILPDSTTLVDYMVVKFTRIVENLSVYPENMLLNIEKTKGLVFSQRLLLKLTEKMGSREKAYQIVQSNAMIAWEKKEDFKKLIKADKRIKKYLSSEEIESCFDLGYFTKGTSYIFKRVFGR